MKFQGTIASSGIAIGKVFKYVSFTPVINADKLVNSEVKIEVNNFKNALNDAKLEVEKIIEKKQKENKEQAEIFAAHLELLEDETVEEEIIEEIKSGEYASKAVDAIYGQYAEVLSKSTDEYMKARVTDIMDVRLRILRCLEHKIEAGLSSIDEAVILVAHDLLPSDTAALDPNKIKGIITEIGGVTSHSAIIARSFGIPALAGVIDVAHSLKDGEQIVLDAKEGFVVTDVDEEELKVYRKRIDELKVQKEEEKKYLDREAVLKSGEKINVYVNIGSGNETELSYAKHFDGVGLYRTEFFYMDREQLPTEDEQFESYKRVLEAYAPNPVTLRTLDIGGDKKAKCLNLPKEENPFLGERALRLCFQNKDMFITQLCAALRASAFGKLKLMFPMVSSIDDLRYAKEYLAIAREQLAKRSEKVGTDYQVGVMIEIPSIALMADILAKEVDFASIGSNDLTQYSLATDRTNPSVAGYYQLYNPGVLRLINYVVKEFNNAGKQISICGELGGNEAAVIALIGMGMKHLSMSASNLPKVKRVICNMDLKRAESILNEILNYDTNDKVKKKLENVVNEVCNEIH